MFALSISLCSSLVVFFLEKMILIAIHFLSALVLPLQAAPVTQTSSATSLIYDAVVVGGNNVVELMPATTGLPSPISTFTNVNVVTCGSGEICIQEILTDSASHATSSAVAEFSLPPASIVTALEGILEAAEVGIEAARASSTSRAGVLSVSRISNSDGLGPTTGSVASSSARQSMTHEDTTSSSTGRAIPTTDVSASTDSFNRVAFTTGALSPTSATRSMISRITGSTTSFSIETGNIKPARNSSVARSPTISMNSATLTSTTPLSATLRLGGSNRTGSTTANISPTGPVTYALEVTNSQGSTIDEVVVGYHSSTSVLFAYADSVSTTETNVPSGVSIQTITTSTCTTAGVIATTTSSGSTVTTEVPELCTHGLLFLIFGLPGFHSSSDLPSLCHKAFAFPLGIIWRLLCPSIGPPTFSFVSVDPEKLPPGGGPPGENPNDGKPDDEKPTETQRPSQTQSSSQTTQSTVSSSAAATPSRYVVMPLIDTPQSAIDSLFALYAQRKNVTPAKRSDGSLKFFASDLNDTEASAIDAKSDFTIIQESSLEIELTDDEETDPGANGSSSATTKVKPRSEMGSRDLPSNMGSKSGSLVKRIPLQGWAEKITTWALAMISLVPGLQLPNYDLDEIYPYYFADAIEPGENVRVYLLDTGMNMRHPEFNGRLKPGIRSGRTQSDWDIDWLFPTVDTNEYFLDYVNSRMVQKRYEYNYIDPDSPNPSGGIHPAYSDFRLQDVSYGKLTPHGTRLSGFIMGDDLGQAQNCHYTVVKLPQYTNGVSDASGVYDPASVRFPLFSVRDALVMIVEDIMERKEQGEEYFVVSSALGYVFGSDPDEHPISSERGFSAMWENALTWFDDNGVTIIASAGNSRRVNPGGEVERNDISLIPARLFHNPRIVVGSVTSNARAHPQSQGYIGDGILTAYAPSTGSLVVSSDPSGAYIYTFLDPRLSAVTSYGTWLTSPAFEIRI